jgi:hypothetical protein
MAGLFFRQLGALFWKNWIVLSKHPIVSRIPDPALLHLTGDLQTKAELNPMLHSACGVRDIPFCCARLFGEKA